MLNFWTDDLAALLWPWVPADDGDDEDVEVMSSRAGHKRADLLKK